MKKEEFTIADLLEVWSDAPLEFIAAKGLSEEFEKWGKKKYKGITS